MNRGKKLLAIIVAVMMFATTFSMMQPIAVTAETTEIEAAVTGGTIKFDTSTGTVTGIVSIDDAGIMEIPETIEGVTVTSIGESAFSRTQVLKEIVLPDSVETIEDYAFQQCYYLTSVTLPENLKSIGFMTFYQNRMLAVITLPDQLETIGEEAFAYSAISGTVEIPASVISMGEPVFNSCANLMAINVAEENTVYKSDDGVLFSADTLVCYPAGKTDEEYTMPVLDGVKYIGISSFANADNLAKVIIAEDVTSIQKNAFYDCTSLSEVEFPSTLTTIQIGAFEATALKTADIPSSVTKVWSRAFDNCKQLTEFNILADAIIYWNSNLLLDGCDALTAINVDESNSKYISNNGVLLSKDGTILWRYPQNHPETTYTVPATVTEIFANAFAGCVDLKEIILQEGLQKIGNQAFWNCDSLQSVTIPEGVTEIEGYAFSSCDSLKVVTIPSSVTTIGSQILYNMSQEIVIVCDEGSAAAEYAANNSVPYSYDGKTIVGTGEEFENPDPVEPTQSEQEIVCDDNLSKVFGCEDFSLNATAQTTLTYVSNNTSVADISTDGTVTVKGAGEAKITITATETDTYMAAKKTVTITVAKADQEISGVTEFSKVYGDVKFNLNQTAETALTYKSNNTAVADVDVEGNVTVKGAGEATITITATTGDNYNTAEKTVTITVAKADQTISGATGFSKVYGDAAFNLNQTAETTLTYKSNNTAVADVSEDGTVTVKGAGQATITIIAAASDNHNSAEKTVTITVTKADQEISGAVEFSKVYGDAEFNLNQKAETDLTYKSNNTEVADVDADGLVTINGAGTANITVTANAEVDYNSAEKTVVIKVAKSAQSIVCDTAISKPYGSEAFNIGASAKTTLYYKSNNTNVADIDKDGTVTIKNAGKAVITITAADSTNYNAAEVKVTITVSKVDQSIECEDEFVVNEGSGTFNLNASAKTAISYKSNNTDIADVDDEGKVIVNGPGTAVITINAEEGINYNSAKKAVTVIVNKVEEPDDPIVEPEDPTIPSEPVVPDEPTVEPDEPTTPSEPDEPAVEPDSPSEPQVKQEQIITGTSKYVKTYKAGGSFYLDASAKTALTYSSSNTAVVKVAADGKVTIKGAGKANITVTAGENGEYKSADKTITVTISKAAQKITCKKTFSKTFKPNGYFYLKAKSPTKKTYKSSNKKIATVSATGKVTMKNPGKVTITITAREGKNYKKVIKKVTVTSKMKKPVLTVKAQKGKKNKLSWTKVPGAHGYKVYIYDKSKGKYICRVTKKANVKSVTHKGLKFGKTYKYKVRAYRVVNGKMVYSPYSKVKSVKAKK